MEPTAPIAAQGEAMPPDETMQGQPMAGDGDGKVSPEEQEQSDRLVINGLNLIFDGKTRDGILKSLDGNGDPVDGLAATAVTVWQHLLKSADQAGFKASGDAMMNAGREIFEHLAEYSTMAGLHNFANDPDATESAYFRALDDIRVVLQKEGRLNPEAVKQDMATLENLDRSGELEKIMMAMAGRDEASSAEDQAEGQEEPGETVEEPPQGSGLMAGVK